MRQTFGRYWKNSENSIESGEIEGKDKLKDQEEKKDYERCRKHKY